MNDVEKAERVQAWKAFLIPSSLFVACLFNAAGIYIIYAGSSIGVIFLGLGMAVIVGGMFAFITFHNQKRAKGQWKRLPEASTEQLPEDDRISPEDVVEQLKEEARV